MIRMQTRRRSEYAKLYVAYFSYEPHWQWECCCCSFDHCVSEKVLYEGDTVSGNFVATDHDFFWSSDHIGIDFTDFPPGDITGRQCSVFSERNIGDKFEFKAPQSGIYKFCFRNQISAPETLSFYVHVGHIPSEDELAKDEHMGPLNIKIFQLKEALESITTEQTYLKARYPRHRYTNVSTKKRVIYFTLAEYIVFARASAL